jgi:hypothetical protein
MSKGFGASQEVREGAAVKFYTGINNFKVVGVNPTKEELEKIYGREINFDPEYIGETEVKDADGDRTVPQIRLDFYLLKEGEDGQDDITTKVQFYVANTHHKSATNKYKVINNFGRSTWLSEDSVKSKTVPDNMTWYNTDGLKVAKRGEEELIGFLVNLLNLPFKIDELGDPSDAYASIDKEGWAKIFAGDVSLFRDIIAGTQNKVGVLLGVKTKADGKLSQTVFNRHTLRQYSLHSTRANKYKYIGDALDNAKTNGAYGNVDFGNDDFEFSEYVVGSSTITRDNSNQTDIFATAGGDDLDDDNWMNQ